MRKPRQRSTSTPPAEVTHFALVAAALCLASCTGAKTAQHPSLQRVDDRAELLSPAVEAQISSKLQDLEKRTSDQVQVMTVASMDGKPIEQFALETARSEGLGVNGKDNGVLLLVAPHERKVRIETGRGIAGVLTDSEAAAIIRTMIPQFRAGQMQQAIETGVPEIDRELRENPKRPVLLRKDEPWPA